MPSRPTAGKTDELALRYVPLDQVQRWDRNPKRHDFGALIQSIQRYGFKDPPKVEPALNGGEGGVVEGNGRAEALAMMQADGAEAPRGIAVDKQGRWCVPVLFGVDARSKAEAEAYGVDHNNLTLSGGDLGIDAILGIWDEDPLRDLLASLAADGEMPVSLDGDDLDALLNHPGEVVEDEAPEPSNELQEKWQVKTGQLWGIGRHRVLCGDSTKVEDTGRLMGGERVGLCFTSPPYAQQRDYTAEAKAGLADWDALMQGVFANVLMTDDGQVLVNLGLVHRDGEWQPYWDGWIAWMREQGWRRFGWYVWDQGAGMMGDWNGRLAPSFEFIWHFNRAPVKARKARECKHAGEAHGGKGQRGADGTVKARHSGKAPVRSHAIHDSVLRVPRQGAARGALGHPAPYPAGLPGRIIESWPGNVYDPFLGSGTTLIAAEQLGRRCFGLEISPEYVAVILERAERFGLTPKLESDG
jgi:DNA modification methylase